MTKARNIADLGSNDVIETTATGVDVTGTVTADGITTSSGIDVDGTDDLRVRFLNDGTFKGGAQVATTNGDMLANSVVDDLAIRSQSNMLFGTGGSIERLRIGSNGDVSFYEDTGTTAKFVWDASAEELEIGSSTDKLELGASFQRFRKGNENKILIGNTSSALGSGTGLINYLYDPEPFIWYQGAERMRIDSSGNVGIGHLAPASKLTVLESSGGNVGFFTNGADADLGINCTSGVTRLSPTTGTLAFGTSSTERARIDSSGNLLVGTTTQYGATGVTLQSDGLVYARRNNTPAYLRRDGGGGDLIYTEINGTFAGAIGYDDSNGFYIDGEGGHTGIGFAAANWLPRDNRAYVDNVVDLGHPSFRFDDLHATNGTIQTSDRNEKQDIAELSDAEQRVAVACKGLLRKFRWKDAVEEKGDEARIHFGIIAQDLQNAFTAEGLDAGRYAMFTSATWTDEETGEERTRLGVRYPELLAFIISAI